MLKVVAFQHARNAKLAVLVILVAIALYFGSSLFGRKEVVKPLTVEEVAFEYVYPIRKAGFRCDEFVRVLDSDAKQKTALVEVIEIKGSTVTSGFSIDFKTGHVERRW